jgi:four helix bundle protein
MKDILIDKSDKLALEVYSVTKIFPREEIYGIVSQIRRASLSVVLNLIEGYARNGNTEYVHFLEISNASLKEAKYLLHYC